MRAFRQHYRGEMTTPTRKIKSLTSPFGRVVGIAKLDALRLHPADSKFFSLLRLMITSPQFRSVTIYRMSHIAGGSVGRLLSGLNLSLHGIDIDPRARIDAGALFQHPVGVVIGGGAIIGAHCTIMSGVVLGRKQVSSGSDPDAYPVVGSNVTLGTSAVLLGPIRVGDYSTIGAQSLVLEDVDHSTTVVGSPAKAIRSNSSKEEQVGR